jgi:predicted Zn-dependent protease
MKKGLKIIFLIIGIVLVSAAVAVVMVKREPWISAEAAFKKGQTNFEKGAYKQAFQYLKMAADKDPGNASYAWTTVKMAVALKNPNAAYLYAQKAWKNGRKERDVLMALVQFSFFSDAKQKMDYALSLVDQMGANVVKDDIRAEVYANFGENQKARQLWEQLFSQSPLPATASKLGRLYLQTGNDSTAFSFLQSCRSQRKLNDDGYSLLAGLYAKRGDAKEAERCYLEASENATTSSDQLNYNHAAFLMTSKNFDRATSMLDSLIDKYPENKNYEAMRLSALLGKGDYNGVLRECDKSSAPIGLIASFRGRALVRLNRIAEAETAFDTAVAHVADLRVRIEFANLLLYALHKPEKARTIFQSVYKIDNKDPLANLGLATLAIEAKDIAAAKKYLDAVFAMKKNIPYAYLLLAQINLTEGKPQDALENCNKVLSIIPGFEKAYMLQGQAYLGLRQFDKTAELYTSLSNAAKNDTAKSNMFRRALIPIKIQQKKFDDALKIAGELDHGANTVETRRIRLEISAVRGNIAQADEILASLKADIPKKDFIFYQSWLAELGGDTVKAAAVLEDGLLSKNLALRWAGLRLILGKTDDVLAKLPIDSITVADWLRLLSIAEKRHNYQFCLQGYKSALKLDAENAALLNNYAWAAMQIPGFDREEVLKTAKKAFMLLSGKPEVLQTYAEALNKCGKPADCIKLLQDKPAIVKQSANLLYQLGSAYEATSDLRGAVSSYKLALSFPESTPDWPSGVDRKELSARMEQLKGKVVSSQ